MQRWCRIAALVSVVTFSRAEARAEPLAVTIEAPPACAAAAAELGRRLTQAFPSSPNDAFEATVLVAPESAGYRVTLRTRRGPGTEGETVLGVPNCEEAVDAALVVLTLAFGTDADVAPSISSPQAVDLPAPAAAKRSAAPTLAAPPAVPDSVDRAASAGAAGSRVALSTGVDLGTLPTPTLFVGTAAAHSFSDLELRGILRYGLPIAEENDDSGVTESMRNDFAAAELRACYGAGVRFRLAACAGGELGVVRETRRLTAENGDDEHEDTLTPRLAGVLSALVAHRGGVIQPELELSGSGVAFGRVEQGRWLVVRVSAGAAVEF